jgi:CcmD family protein
MRYLYAAYAATWIIHLTYIGILGMRYKRLKRETKDVTAGL